MKFKKNKKYKVTKGNDHMFCLFSDCVGCELKFKDYIETDIHKDYYLFEIINRPKKALWCYKDDIECGLRDIFIATKDIELEEIMEE